MATDPQFAATVVAGSALVTGTADTSLTAPTSVATVLTAGTSGTRVEEITAVGVGSTVAGLVNVFLYDGATYHLYDQYVVAAITTSTTTASWSQTKRYANLVLPSGWSLRVTNTIAGNVSLVKVTAVGGNF